MTCMAPSRTLESLVEVYVDPDRRAAEQAASCKEIAKYIQQERLTIQHLVLSLGTYLTTTDNIVRARGTALLSEILAELCTRPLDDSAIKSLTNFYSSRLGDWHSLRSALLGSLSLLRRTTSVGAVEVEDAREMAKSALENLHVQALAQRDRILCLELFECLLDKHSAAVAPLEGDLVFGVVAAIEEEKDPRCLLLVFRILELLANLYPDPDGPVASCAEDLFDVASRYFPISFNPQPGSPDGITRDDLATALKRAFACTPLFAPFCIPLLLDKLSSSLRRAKLDSLNYLGHCALMYGAGDIIDHAASVWGALKAELLPLSVPSSATSPEPKDPEIVKEATSCLTSWVAAFQHEKDLLMPGDPGSIEAGEFLHLVLKDEYVEDLITCVKNASTSPKEEYDLEGRVTNDRAKLRAEATGLVLGASAQASPSSCFVVCRQVLTRFIALRGIAPEKGPIPSKEGIVRHNVPQLNGSTPVPTPNGDSVVEANADHGRSDFRSVIGLDVVLRVLQAARSLAGSQEQSSGTKSATGTLGKSLDPLREQSEDLIAAFCQAIAVKVPRELPALGVAGLQALASFPSSLSPLSADQLRNVLTVFKKMLICDTVEEDLWSKILTALENISNVEEKSGAMVEGGVGILTVVIPHLLEAVREAKTGFSVEKQLAALAKICGPRPVARQLAIESLTETIRLVLSGADANEELDEVSGKLVVILQCLSKNILPWCDGKVTEQSVVAKLSMEIWSVVNEPGLRGYEEVLKWSLEAMRAAVVKCDTTAQRQILQKGVELLVSTATRFQQISSNPQDQVEKDQTNSFKRKASEEEIGWSVALTASVIVSLRLTTEVPKKLVLLEMMMRAAISEEPPLITETAAQAAASLLNKWVVASTDEAGDSTLEDAVHLVLDGGLIRDTCGSSIVESPMGTETRDSVRGSRSVRRKVCGVRAAAWVGKALAMRGHIRVADVASLLLRLLLAGTSEEGEAFSLALAAAQGLGVIMKDTDDCLDKVHHAVVRPLYKQRFFSSMLSPLMEAVRASSASSVRLWLYRGVGHLISGTPHAALLAHGEKAFPMLLGALSFLCTDPRDSDLLLSTLLALSAFLVDANYGRSIAAEHVSSIVKRLLTLVQYQYASVVRETALQCLGAVVGFPYARVYPMRAEVMRAIPAALDDEKRVVRREAVRCRQAWTAIASR